jgi:hypothetical protein
MSDAPRDLERQLQKLEAVLGELERGPESPIRAQAREVVRVVLELHASGLQRMLQCIGDSASGAAIMSAFASDPLIAGLLMLHEIHPENLETRVRAAVEALEPTLAPQGARVAQLSVADGVVRVRVEREMGRGHLSSGALRSSIEQAIFAAAPDAGGIEVDVPDTVTRGAFVPVTEVRMRDAREARP